MQIFLRSCDILNILAENPKSGANMEYDKDPLELVDQEKVGQFSEKMVYGGCGSIDVTGSWGRYVDILWEFPEDIDSDTYHIKTEIALQLKEYLLSLGCEVSYLAKAVPRPD